MNRAVITSNNLRQGFIVIFQCSDGFEELTKNDREIYGKVDSNANRKKLTMRNLRRTPSRSEASKE